MAPFLPVIGISRSQSIRIGRSPNAVTVGSFDNFPSTGAGVSAQTGALEVPAYIDLGDGNHRRDLQRHSALGALITVGSISQTVTSDLFWQTAGPAATSTYPNLVISGATVVSRTFGNTLAVGGQTLTIPANSTGSTRVDRVVVNQAGQYTYLTGGTSAPATPANQLSAGTVSTTTGNVSTWTTSTITS